MSQVFSVQKLRRAGLPGHVQVVEKESHDALMTRFVDADNLRIEAQDMVQTLEVKLEAYNKRYLNDLELFGKWQEKEEQMQRRIDELEKFLQERMAISPSPTFRAKVAAVLGDPAKKIEPVDGDLLPTIGSKVFIHLGRSDSWVEHTVVGYYAWDNHGLDKNVHRVFVRVRDSQGYLNARLLNDIRLASPGCADGEKP